MESSVQSAQSSRRKSTGQGILKMKSQDQSSSGHQHDHIKFDEEIIAEHDKSRGTRQKIDEPKTPYADDTSDMIDTDDQLNTNANVQINYTGDDTDMQDHSQINQHDPNSHKVEEEVKRHLEEAERNKMLNAQLQKEQSQQASASLSAGVNQNFNDQLMQKLDNTQQELDEEERKHKEFLAKRKEHYKNELKAAQLLRAQSKDEEEEDDE